MTVACTINVIVIYDLAFTIVKLRFELKGNFYNCTIINHTSRGVPVFIVQVPVACPINMDCVGS